MSKAKAKATPAPKPKPDGYIFGRPTKYNAEYCELVVLHMSQGKALRSFGPKIGVHLDTLYEWQSTHKDFSEAIKQGRDRQYAFLEEKGLDGFFNTSITNEDGSKVNCSLNTRVWELFMQNMFDWSRKTDIKAETQTQHSADPELTKLLVEKSEKLAKLLEE